MMQTKGQDIRGGMELNLHKTLCDANLVIT